MAVSPAVVKAAITLATDKRTWIVVGSVICGLVLMVVGTVAAFLNIFTYDDTNSATASAAYVEFINEIKDGYKKLDSAADAISENLDKDTYDSNLTLNIVSDEKIEVSIPVSVNAQ